MINIITNEKDLKSFLVANSDYDAERCYIAMNAETKECFGILGCTYATEAYACVKDECNLVITQDDDEFHLVITQDVYYEKKIKKQSDDDDFYLVITNDVYYERKIKKQSDDPHLNPFFLKKGDLNLIWRTL